jgi:hypothetical protein
MTHREMGNPAWPHDPYKGLANYEFEDQHLFAGRDEEIDSCAQLLANAQTKLLVLHGQTGCGKSSFLRAGLIPALEQHGAGYLFLRKPSASVPGRLDPSFIRCGADPLARIAEEIHRFAGEDLVVAAAKGPKTIDLGAARLGIVSLEAFIAECADPHRLFVALERLTNAVPHTLVLVLDQVEEIITLNSSGKGNHSRFARFVKELVTSDIDMRFVLAIRKDHSGQFIESVQVGNETSPAFRTFFLSDLSPDGIREAILRPTLRTLPKDGSMPGPFEFYQFEYAPGVVDQIVDDLEKMDPAGAILPVMQIVCRDLYEQVSKMPLPRVIGMRIFNQGGIKGRVTGHLVQSLREVLIRNRGRGFELAETGLKWLRVLARLVLEEGDGRVHTNVVPRSTLVDWAESVGIDGDIDPVIDGLSDPKVLVLRQFSVFAPGVASEHALFCLGHDMVGIALREALRNAEERQYVNEIKRNQKAKFGALSLIALAGLALIAGFYLRADIERIQKVSTLLAQSSLSRSTDVLQALAVARDAQAAAQGILNGDERPDYAIAALLSGLPIPVKAKAETPPLAPDSYVYPTYALDKPAGLATLRSKGVLETYTLAGQAVDTQTLAAPEPLLAVAGKLDLLSLQFSRPSSKLLLALYAPLSEREPAGVVAWSPPGSVKLFRQDELADALGRQNSGMERPRLFGLSGDSIILFSLASDEASMRLATVRVADSLRLVPASTNDPETFPLSSQVDGQFIVSYFHPVTEVSIPGIPTRTVSKVTAKKFSTPGGRQQWDVSNFKAVQKCMRRNGAGQGCNVTAIPDLQQPGIVVLGLWGSSKGKGRYGVYPRAFISDLMIIDLEKASATEVDLRLSSTAKQACDFTGRIVVTIADTPAVLSKNKDELTDDDVPTFVAKGRKGLLLGYASRTAAQLIDVSSTAMPCAEIFIPNTQVDGWRVTDGGDKLLGLTWNGGFVWNLQATSKPEIADAMTQACGGQLRQFVPGPNQGAAKENAGNALLARICQ